MISDNCQSLIDWLIDFLPRNHGLRYYMETFSDIPLRLRMAADAGDDSLYPIAVLIDELRNEDVQVTDLLRNLTLIYSLSWGWIPSRSFLQSRSLLALSEPGRSWSHSWRTQSTTRTRCCWPWQSSWEPSPLLLVGRSMCIASCLLLSPLQLLRRLLWGTR